MRLKLFIIASCFGLLTSCVTYTGGCGYPHHCCPKDNELCLPCKPCNNYYPCIDHVDKWDCEY